MRKLKSLTNEEAIAILRYVLEDDKFLFTKVILEPEINKDGSQRVTFNGNSIVGICYKAGFNMDGFLLRFDNPKVVKWLYLNNFEIEDLLDSIDEEIKDLDSSVTELFSANYDMTSLLNQIIEISTDDRIVNASKKVLGK